MAWTDLGKAKVMDEGIDGATRYVSLHLTDDTELSGHGYARKAVSTGDITVSATDGTTTLPTNLSIYTANDGSAQRAQKVGLYNSSSGADQLLEPEAITSPPAAPISGQELQLTITITP